MARDEFLVFGSPLIEEPEIAEVVECLRSGWIGTGPRVARFEERFREYKEAEHDSPSTRVPQRCIFPSPRSR